MIPHAPKISAALGHRNDGLTQTLWEFFALVTKQNKRHGKKLFKMPPKQRKRGILSKGSSEPRGSSWTSSPGAGWVWGRQPQQLQEHLEPSPPSKACGKGQAGSEEGSSCHSCCRDSLQTFPTSSPPGFLSLLKAHESVFPSGTQQGILSSTPNPCGTPLPMLMLI